MKVGDLVQFSQEVAMIVAVNPLGEDSLYAEGKTNELLVLRNDGCLWHIVPEEWRVVNESR